jgi:hypothetical protein
MTLITRLALGSLVALLPATARAQAPAAQPKAQAPAKAATVVTKEHSVTAAVTIEAIDKTTRSITVRSENGDEDTYTVSPDVKRFDQLKVGDKIRATYYESLVLQLRKPGEASTPQSDSVAGGRMQQRPGVAVGAQQTRTVTVKAVNMDAGSITVATEDGHTVTRTVEDKKNLEGVHPGDRIDITYTQALVVNAEAAK